MIYVLIVICPAINNLFKKFLTIWRIRFIRKYAISSEFYSE